jgi:hypothetical protein
MARAAVWAVAAMMNAIDLVLVRALTLDVALGRALAFGRALGRALARDLALALSLDLALVLDCALDLAHARAHAHDIALNLDLARDRDLAFILALIFAQQKYPEGVHQLTVALAKASRKASQVEVANALNGLRLPAEGSNDTEWQAYVDKLQALLTRYRNMGHEWNFTDEQWLRIDQYEQGTVLLAECLRLAAVSDRKAIENRLLLSPS